VLRIVRLVAIWVVASVGATAIVVAAAPQVVRIGRAHREVPLDLPALARESRRSLVYDVKGNTIDVLRVENREPFALDKVPRDVVDAVLAVEDSDFWQHHGANGRSVVRALLANVSAGGTEQGGSTITQQVVKNLIFPTLPRDVQTKVLEAVTAVRLEKEIGKRAVLERYLNTVYLGNNAYGFQAASEVYFGKNVDQLSLIEAGFLAGMVRNPTEYDPFLRPDRSRFRFRQVLDRLVAVGRLTEGEATTLADGFALPDRPQRPPQLTTSRSYFSDAVKDYLLNGSTILGETYTDRYNALFRGGLRIFTTLNPDLQLVAEQAATLVPKTAQGFEVALVTLDTRSGAVVAVRGGPGFETSQVNLTTRGRQTGSSVKFFILAAALAAGATPKDVIDGASPCTLPNPGNPKDPFVIRDAVSKPTAPLEQQTWSSINCAYARLAQVVGLNRVVDTMKRMGVNKSPLIAVPSLATGNNEVSPLEMASGFQTLANLGLRHEPYYVERIETADGDVLFQHDDPGTQVFDPGVAATAIDTLKGVLTRGTGRRGQLEGGRPAAGKTGTQFKNTNAWFVGATPALTTAVWMGDPKGQTPMQSIPEFSADGFSRIQGGTYPVLVWKAFNDAAHLGFPAEDWPAPPPPARSARRLYLPGNECVFAGGPPVTQPPNVPVDPAAPPVTAAPPKVDQKATGTTVPADVVDPTWPLPSVAAGAAVYNCANGPPRPTAPPTTVPVAGAPPPVATAPPASSP
jgi:penicillin-binding protein 1A